MLKGPSEVFAETDAPDKESDKLQVGFVLVGPTSDWGFNYQHNQGRLALEARLRDKVHTVVAENIPETAEAERIMQRHDQRRGGAHLRNLLRLLGVRLASGHRKIRT